MNDYDVDGKNKSIKAMLLRSHSVKYWSEKCNCFTAHRHTPVNCDENERTRDHSTVAAAAADGDSNLCEAFTCTHTHK